MAAVRAARMTKSLVGALVFATLLPVIGDAADPINSKPANTSMMQSETTISTPTTTARSRANEWGLTPTEWQRYQTLLSGVRGSISPATISPIEVLGIHARDDGERRRYARVWARLLHEDTERILAFQHAYDDATRDLYPNEPLIASTPSAKPVAADEPLAEPDRILLFVAPNCPACDERLARVMKQLDRAAGIDLYLAQVSTPAQIRIWAATHAIDPMWVRAGRVTLNLENGTLAKLGHADASLPVLMRRRGDTISELAAGTLQ